MAANKNIPVTSSIRRWLLPCFALVFIATIAWTYQPDPIPMGPYQLVYPANFGNRINVPDDNPTTQQGVYLGRMLFYEPLLSANGKISCGTCHQQALAFTDGKAFSEGVDHTLTPRSSMSLANLLWARKFFWDGRSESLEKQAAVPMTNPHEMGQLMQTSAHKLMKTAPYPELFRKVFGDEGIDGPNIMKAIAQFERTLISANSKYDQYLRKQYQPTRLELQGLALFENAPQPAKSIRGANCARCHGGAKTYMELFHNNGLDSIPKDIGIAELTGLPGDRGRFKVPTLRNIALTAPYMHDGRFKTLDEVLDHYSDHVKRSESLSPFLRGESNEVNGKSLALKPEEKKAVIAFLNMLTDSTFVTDPRFSDPHQNIAKNK
ncbi:cytochrome-c peroxidase [Mucilaginibacter mali]|uniref:Cytochrome-c peroxidase n=1 Tax=Mucilaginibacter mali TaxID=2740462 RepID=A0A7D4QEK3_9SPHI|nr:cytochrome c peroxidase [Mucilaginibacter mali]QKJ32104.1 cytochrome-c peroxidase [Mucilaginibacter mali]